MEIIVKEHGELCGSMNNIVRLFPAKRHPGIQMCETVVSEMFIYAVQIVILQHQFKGVEEAYFREHWSYYNICPPITPITDIYRKMGWKYSKEQMARLRLNLQSRYYYEEISEYIHTEIKSLYAEINERYGSTGKQYFKDMVDDLPEMLTRWGLSFHDQQGNTLLSAKDVEPGRWEDLKWWDDVLAKRHGGKKIENTGLSRHIEQSGEI